MASNTRRLVIEVDISGGSAALREINNLGASIDNLSDSQENNVRVSQTLNNANVNRTRRFAEEQRTMSGLVKTYAITAANIFALSAAYNLLRENANLDIMLKSSEQLGRTTGVNYGKVAESLKDITNGALNMKEALQAATLGTAGGASTQQLEQITAIATKAAQALGRSVPDAVSRMVQAVTKAEPELVDEFGIILRMSEATDKYALSVGKTVSQLNTMEKQQAILNQLIEQGNNKFKNVDIENNVNQFDRLAATLTEVAAKILSFVSGPVSSFISVFSDNTGLLLSTIALGFASVAKSALPTFKLMGEGFKQSSEDMILASREANEEIVKHFETTQKRLAKRRNERLAGTSTFRDAETLLRGALGSQVESIQNARGAGGVFTAAERGINVEALKQKLREAANSMARIEIEINGRMVSLSNSAATRIVQTLQNARNTAHEELGPIQKLIDDTDQKLAELGTKGTKASIAVTTAIGDMHQRIAEIVGQAFSGETLLGARDRVNDLIDAQNEAAEAATGFGGIFQRTGNIIVATAGRMALILRGLSTVINGILWPIAIVYATIAALKQLAVWTGATTKAVQKADDELEKLQDSLPDLQEGLAKTGEELSKNAANVTELVEKYTKLGNTVRSVSGEIEESLSVFSRQREDLIGFFGINSSNLLFKAIGKDFGKRDALEQALLRVKELRKLTGTAIDLRIQIDGESIDLAAEDAIKRLGSKLSDPAIQDQVRNKISTAIQDQVKNITSLEGATKDLDTATKNLNKSFAEQSQQFLQANPLAQHLNTIETLNNAYKDLVKQGKILEAQAGVISALDAPTAAEFGIDKSAQDAYAAVLQVQNALSDIQKLGSTDAFRMQLLDNMIKDSSGLIPKLERVAEVIAKIKEKGEFRPGDVGLLQKALEGDAQDVAGRVGDIGSKLQKQSEQTTEQLRSQLVLTTELQQKQQELSALTNSANKDTLESTEHRLFLEKQIEEIKLKQLDSSILAAKKELDKATVVSNKDKSPVALLNLESAASVLRKLQTEKELIENNLSRNFNNTVIQATLDLVDLNSELEKWKLKEVQISTELDKQNAILNNPSISLQERSNVENERLKLLKEQNAVEFAINDIGRLRTKIEGDINREKGDQLAVQKSLVQQQEYINKQTAGSLKLEEDKLKTFENQLAIKKQQLDSLVNESNLSEKKLNIVKAISDNEAFDPVTRINALKVENTLIDNNLKDRTKLNEATIAYNEEVIKSGKYNKDSAQYLEAQRDINTALLDTQQALVSAAEARFEFTRKQNEIDKQLVDRGLKDFNKTFQTSMALAAQDFAKSIGTSVDRAVRQVLGAIDATLDTTFENIGAVIKGEKTGKEALESAAKDLSSFFLDSAFKDAKDQLKLGILGLFGGDVNKFATPQEETNNWLEEQTKLQQEMVALLGGKAISSAIGVQPGSSSGFGGNMFKDIWKGIKSVSSSISENVDGFFTNLPGFATGGIVPSNTIANIAESGPEAVIPLAGGSVPVQLSGDTASASIKALVAVGDQMKNVVANGDEQLAQMRAWDISVNTIGQKIIVQIGLSTSQIVNAISSLQSSILLGTSVSTVAAGLTAVAGLVSTAASAYGSSSGGGGFSGSSASSASSAITPAFQSGSYATGGIIDRPTRALMGEGRNSEAVVPLPNNRSIPVMFTDKNNNLMNGDAPVQITVNIVGVRDEGGLNRSANQIALESARAAQRALRRDG